MKKYFCTSCGREHNGKYSSKYCRKHQWQLAKFGKILDSNPRTKYDPNEFRFINGYVEFDTYNYPSQDICKTYIIDAEDYPKVSKLKWFTLSTGYAYCRESKVLLHRLIMNGQPGQEFDHINLDILDNRKSNLRLCTSGLNKLNKSPRKNSPAKGVTQHKNGKFSVCVINKGKKYISPCYNTLKEAAFARYILEQLFVEEYLTQHHNNLINELNETEKETIISGVKNKFNID